LLGLIFDSSIDETGLTELLSKTRLSDPLRMLFMS
jgi:hypothetical protein